MNRRCILFVYRLASPFVLADLEILKRNFDVVEFDWRQHVHPARALAWWMLRHSRKYDLAFFWFGAGHATVGTRVAKLLGKPSIIQVGGFDLSDLPDYGFLATKRGVRWAASHFEKATRILTVSEQLRRTLVHRFPKTEPKAVVLPTGVDVDRFLPGGARMTRVLSVAPAETGPRAWVKGLDQIAATAQAVPNIPFVVIGVPQEVAAHIAHPPNLTIKGPMPQEGLVAEYQATEVYLQASRSEGMPNALMEAMACGCVPVVTNVGGMPELVDGIGFTARDVTELAASIRKAFAEPERGHRARLRIVEHYSIKNREERLVRVVKEVLGDR